MNEPTIVFDAKKGVMKNLSHWDGHNKRWINPEEPAKPAKKKAKKK